MCAQYGGGHQEILSVRKALLLLQPSWMRVLCPEAMATCPNIHTHPASRKETLVPGQLTITIRCTTNREKPRGGGRNLQNDSLADVATGVAQIQCMQFNTYCFLFCYLSNF